MMNETYKDWEIEYVEDTEKFVAIKKEHMLESPSLKELKKKIDVFFFKREKVYYWTDTELHEAEITSIIQDTYNDCRISFMDTDYQGKPMTSNFGVKNNQLYPINEKNKEIFEKINKLHSERKELWCEIEDMQKILDRYKKEE